MQCHRNSEFALRLVFGFVIYCATVVMPVSPSHGGELPTEQAAIYLNLSLGNNGVLRKIARSEQLAVHVVCKRTTSSKCNNSMINKRINDAYRGNNRFKVKVTAQNPDIEFVFADATSASIKKRELLNLYLAGFVDSDDPDCQLYYSIKENVIEKVVIVVSMDSPELKQRLCLALQLSHGLGLSLPYDLPFSKLWNLAQAPDGLPDGQKAFTDDDVTKLTRSTVIWSYIHMCPDLKAGMKADDIKRVLLESPICTDGLKPLPKKLNGPTDRSTLDRG